MFRGWPFFRAVLGNVEMVLAKSDMGVAERYAELAEPAARAAVWPKVRAQHARTVQWVKRIQGTPTLLESNRTLRRSMQLRNPYVDPMSFLQVELLRRSAPDERIDRALLLVRFRLGVSGERRSRPFARKSCQGANQPRTWP